MASRITPPSSTGPLPPVARPTPRPPTSRAPPSRGEGTPGPLGPGAYKVAWRAVGGDPHIISGEFGFTVVAATTR